MTSFNLQKHFFYLHNIRISGKTINFDNKNINKSKFYKTKRLFKIDDININKILISKKIASKYFIAYKDHEYIGPLCIKLPQMNGYVKCFDNNKAMPFKVTDNNILEKISINMEKSQQLNKY